MSMIIRANATQANQACEGVVFPKELEVLSHQHDYKYLKLLNNIILMPSAIAGRLALYSSVLLRSQVHATAVLCDPPSYLPLDVVKTFCIPGLAPQKEVDSGL